MEIEMGKPTETSSMKRIKWESCYNAKVHSDTLLSFCFFLSDYWLSLIFLISLFQFLNVVQWLKKKIHLFRKRNSYLSPLNFWLQRFGSYHWHRNHFCSWEHYSRTWNWGFANFRTIFQAMNTFSPDLINNANYPIFNNNNSTNSFWRINEFDNWSSVNSTNWILSGRHWCLSKFHQTAI